MAYIDRDVLMTYEHTIRIGTYSHRCIDATIITEMPTADVVEVVRCKDCKWFDESYPLGTFADGVFRCNRVRLLWMPKDAFCSFGERREDAEV